MFGRPVGGLRHDSMSASMDGFDDNDDEKDDTKRKSRNLSEKKRRDQFNMLVTELGTMVSSNTRKMDKTTVLKTTISFLKKHNEHSVRSESEEIKDDWKPAFLSNEEFINLMLEGLDGFVIVLGTDGHILYTSESLVSLLGYLPASLHNTTLYEIVEDVDKIPLYNHLNMNGIVESSTDQQIRIQLHIRRSTSSYEGAEAQEIPQLELVELSGYFRKWINPENGNVPDTGCLSDDEVSIKSGISVQGPQTPRYRTFQTDKTVFVATGRLVTPQLIKELSVVHQRETEFTSRHSLEWKFLFLDHRAPPIIGYLPFELLGTSGYDYYHVDDLDAVAACHEALRQTGECTSCFYRFLTKGQQWIWLQSRYYITYHQWNSKPEFIVATHKVVNYNEVLSHNENEQESQADSHKNKSGNTHSFRSGTPTWSSKSSLCGSSGTGFASSSRISQSEAGDNPPSSQMNRHRLSRCSTSLGDEGILQMQIQQDPAMSDSISGMEESGADVSGADMSDCGGLDSAPLVLSPAQQQLQQQLRTKHAELARRIASQQEELLRLGNQLALTPQSHNQSQPSTFKSQQQPQVGFTGFKGHQLVQHQLQIPQQQLSAPRDLQLQQNLQQQHQQQYLHQDPPPS